MKLRLAAIPLMAILLLGFIGIQPTTISAIPEHAQIKIPEKAKQIAPGIYSLGQAKNVDGKIVDGIMFIDYKKDNAKPDGTPGKGNGGKDKASICYSFMAKGAKWKSIEGWIVNTQNTQGLSESFVFDNLSDNIQKWETAAEKDIFGSGTTTDNQLEADTIQPDGDNEVYFGSIDEPGVIAVTIVWGIFSGNPNNRVLVEWDQVYDEVDFDWSSSGEAGKMDFENIATHEIGHSLGLSHPDNSCTEETMYAYASEGETKKQDLNAGDIAGIRALYG